MADNSTARLAEAGDEEMADAADSDSESDSSSSSGSEFEELDVSPEDAQLLLKLEQQLQDNPNLYDSHVQYIEVLRRCKITSKLREARHAMHAAFPLTESLWFDWLSDEIEGLSDADDIPQIEALMEEAVQDYLSIPLWVQYLEFVRDFDPEVTAGASEGQAKMRDLCERALTAGGLHAREGGRLWAVYRGYELGLLQSQPSEEQQERVRGLWVRQLHVPLADGPNTLAAYKAWERGVTGNEEWEVPEGLKQGYAKAQQAVELRQPYEQSVAPGKPVDADLLAAYMAYVKVEERASDPARVQVVYERAVAAFPVTHYLWLQYARYLEAQLKINSVVNAAYTRALRNCPWVGQLWGRALRALERSSVPDEQHSALYERALAAGLQAYEDYLEVMLARLDCLRRRGAEALPTLRAAFQQASEVLHSYFPDQVDRTFRLTSYWAECEAGLGGDMPAARAVWEAAIKGPAGRYADTWGAYIDFERRRGHTREARTLYKRCYSRRLEEGGQALLCDAWLRFEREEGSAEDHLAACLKVEPLLQELQAAAAAVADPQQHAVARSAADRAPQVSREEMREMRQQADPNFAKRKQRGGGQEQKSAAASTGAGEGEMPPPPAKKLKTAAAPWEGHAPSAAPNANHGQQAERPAADPRPDAEQQLEASQPAAAAEVRQAASEQQQQREPAHHVQKQQHKPGAPAWRQQRRTEANTAFVKHLPDDVDEAAVQELFGGCGQITSISLGRDKDSGRFKGFAYVHFASQEGLDAACQLNNNYIRGKHLFVAPSKPPVPGEKQQLQQQIQQEVHQRAQQQARGQGGAGGGRDGSGRDGGGRSGGSGGGGGRASGGRDSGRGRGGGRDGGRGRGGGQGSGGAPGPKHRSMIDLGSDQQPQASGPPRGFMPRAAALQGKGQQQGAEQPAAAASEAPKSNEEFRKMFLSKK